MGETEEEAHDERVKYLERKPSIDEVEIMDPPGFSDFHADGIKRDIEAKKGRDMLESQSRSGEGMELTAESTLTRRHHASAAEE